MPLPSPRRPVPARRRLLGLGPAQLITLELAALAVLLLPHTTTVLPATAGTALVVAVLAVGRWRGRWLYERLAIRRELRRRHRIGWDRGGPLAVLGRWEIVDEPGRTGDPVAVLRDELGWSALLAVEPGDLLTTSARPDAGGGSGATGHDAGGLWDVVAGALGREPVRPAAVQFVVHTRPGPAGPVRRWWLALRLEPVRSAAAIAERGGGHTGARRAARAAALRLATDLSVQGLTARPLGAAEARAVLRLTAGPPHDGTETRTGWRHGDTGQRCFWVRRLPDATGLAALTARPGVVSTTFLVPSGAPEPVATRHPAADRTVGCRILVRSPSHPHGLSRLDGEHGPALLATVPLAIPAPHRCREHRLPVAALAALTRAAPTGDLLIGYGAGSEPVLARLHRSVPTRVALLGGVYPAALLVLRAVAAGARATVVTTRPAAWQPLVRPTIGPTTPPPIDVVAPQDVPTRQATPGRPTLLVLDSGSPEPPAEPWLTVVQLVGNATATTARALHTADLVLAHRVTHAEARLLCAERHLPTEQAYWLAESPDDGLATVVDGDLRYLRLAATEAETAQLGPPAR
jgi:type VII secretion protein EccE